MKRIVICCDGTWNTPDTTDNSNQLLTNVEKMSQVVLPSETALDGTLIPQITYYHNGVGTGNALDRLAGGAFGVGISQCLEDCYRFLVNNYEEGDQVFFFGFSRGAYTARSLVGLIHNSGLLEKFNIGKYKIAYQLYRDRSKETDQSSELAKTFREQFCSQDFKVHFLGVWDTVGSLGVPDFLFSQLLASEWNFHDVTLSEIVMNGYHALAIDEKREDFKPTLWELPPSADPKNFEQRWFAGVHSDVGGGYVEVGLSDLAFLWMTGRAQRCGLKIDLNNIEMGPNYRGVLHDSKTGLFVLKPDYHRPITTGVIDPSARKRKEDLNCNYNPPNWPNNASFGI